jgi:hypothetical protein
LCICWYNYCNHIRECTERHTLKLLTFLHIFFPSNFLIFFLFLLSLYFFISFLVLCMYLYFLLISVNYFLSLFSYFACSDVLPLFFTPFLVFLFHRFYVPSFLCAPNPVVLSLFLPVYFIYPYIFVYFFVFLPFSSTFFIFYSSSSFLQFPIYLTVMSHDSLVLPIFFLNVQLFNFNTTRRNSTLKIKHKYECTTHDCTACCRINELSVSDVPEDD